MEAEREKLLKLAQGDHQVFKEIFRVYYAKIHAFIYGFLKNTDDTDELTQLVFIKVWDKRETFQHVKNFDSYLFMLTKYTVFNFIEAKHLTPLDEEEIPLQSDNNTPYDNLIAHDLKLLIELTVSNMPFQRQQIFRMSREQGLSNEQIAIKLGIQKKTVENHLHLALKELKNVITILLIVYIMLNRLGVNML